MGADCNPLTIPRSLFMLNMCVYVFLFSCPVSPISAPTVCRSLHCALLLSVRLSVSPCPSLRSIPFFLSPYLCVPLITHPSLPPAHACLSPQQPPSYLVLFTVEYLIIKSRAVTLGFIVCLRFSLPHNSLM